jgi:cathepsin O
MKSYVKSTGPLATCLDASNWASYTSGVLSVCGTDIDHCIQVVGISISSDSSYWVVRNSWGTDWGLDGYIYLEYVSSTLVLHAILLLPCFLGRKSL